MGLGLHNHNVGFGIPDAGELVQLASQWHTRDPLVVKSFSTQPLVMIPGCWASAQGRGGHRPRSSEKYRCFHDHGFAARSPHQLITHE